MKVAIIGSGISALSAAYDLKKLGHEIWLFESDKYFGGHTNTVDVKVSDKIIHVDTGFLVHNDRTYPHLIELFRELQIPVVKSDMSLSVQSLGDDIEWAGSNPFLQKKNYFSIKFYRMIVDILKFNKRSADYLKQTLLSQESLGELLEREKYSRYFRDWYLLPMGAAIWSSPSSEMLSFPAYSFLRFCQNHGLLQIFNHIPWKTIQGGGRVYVERIIQTLDHVFLNEPVVSILRGEKIQVATSKRSLEFDMVVSGVHAPTNLKIVKDLKNDERDILEAFKYQANLAVLHSDESFLPQNKDGWSSWNYTLAEGDDGKKPVSVSYYINKLQPLGTDVPMIVTLNPHKEIRSDLIIQEIQYEHPLFDEKAVSMQSKIQSIQGRGNLYFVGAWQRYGFHEDGIWSAKQVLELIKKRVVK